MSNHQNAALSRSKTTPAKPKSKLHENKKRIALIGLGPHSRRIYYPLLQKHAQQYNIEIPLLVDLKSQAASIESYLAQCTLQPKQLYLIDDQHKHHPDLDHQLAQTIIETCGRSCDSIIIASEAQTHEAYIRFALKHNLHVLTDKPISAPKGVSTSIDSAESIYERFTQIEQRLEHSTGTLSVQCQRRSHVGYQLIHDYLAEFLQTYEIPLSYLNIYHGDGMWPMPTEMFQRENHPYKYGYGKLMHSGYHFVDLFAWIVELNQMIPRKVPNNVEMFVQTFRPSDLLHQISQRDYQKMFSQEPQQNCGFQESFTKAKLMQAQSLGELDAFIQCQLKQDDLVVTTGSIDLQQNSFSRRAWAHEPADVYKGNGRVRHERINLQVGNILNIQVHSYQSHESKKAPDSVIEGSQLKSEITEAGPGHDAHFDIHIYRNSGIIGGKAYEKFAIGNEQLKRHQDDSSYLGHNERAREKVFLDFLNRRAGDSAFSTHKLTNLLLAKIYRCMAQAHNHQVPYTTFEI